jgi:hypothetical protein
MGDRCKREKRIKMDIKGTGCGDVDWIQLAQDKAEGELCEHIRLVI